MITSQLPLDLARYQLRFEGSRPMPARVSREMQGLAAAGTVEVDDEAQAMQDGQPVWAVRLSLRDRATGAAAMLVIRTVAPVLPHGDIAEGVTVTADRLAVQYSEYNGRLNQRWSYSALRQCDPGESAIRSGRPLERFAIDASGIEIRAIAVEPKLEGHEEDVRALITSGRLDGSTVARQKLTRDGVPQWVVHCRIEVGIEVSYESITIPATGEPGHLVDKLARAEGLSVLGWTIPGRGGNAGQVGVALSAEALHLAHTAVPSGRGRRNEAPAEQPEPVAV